MHTSGNEEYEHDPQMLVGHRSRKRIDNFRLHRPTTLDDAWGLWADRGPLCMVMAGGIEVINRLKNGNQIDELISLANLDELKGIRISKKDIRLGALTTHHELSMADLPQPFDTFARIWCDIANPRVRFKGTLAGNILAADSAFDATPCLEALGARVVGRRRDGVVVELTPISAAAASGELLVSDIVIPREVNGFAYERSERPLVSVALASFVEADNTASLRMSIGCAFDKTIAVKLDLARPVSSLTEPAFEAQSVLQLTANLPIPRSDTKAGARYRTYLIRILAVRALRKLVGHADGK